MTKQKFAFLGLAVAILGAAACSDKTTTVTVPPPALTISVTPQSVNLDVGQTAQIVAAVTGGEATTDKSVTWSSSNTSVATISANGNVVTVTAAAPGVSTISAVANADANVSAAAIVTVGGGAQPSISIKSITAPNGTAVNPNNVAGQVLITLNLDVPTGSTVSAVKVLANGTEIYSQTISQPVLGTNDEAQSASELVASWTTSDFAVDFAAGSVLGKYKNGPTDISAQVIGSQGTIQAQTNQTLLLNNPAIVYARLNLPSTTATDAGGLVWYSGDIVVDALGVKYNDNANDDLKSVTLANDENGSTSEDTDGSDGFQLTLQKAHSPTGSTIEDVEVSDLGLKLTSVTTGGTQGPTCVVTDATPTPLNLDCATGGGNVVLAADLNWDNVAPTVTGNIHLPSASNWIGPVITVKSLAQDLTITDGGVGKTTNLLQYAQTPVTTSTTFTDAPNGPSDVPESTLNTDYEIHIHVCDAVNNCDDSNAATVGSDQTLPTLTAATSNAAANTAVAAGTILNFTVADVPSGPDATPGKVTLVRHTPTVDECQIGTAATGGGCKDASDEGSNQLVAVTLPGPDGYTDLTIQGEDNAFNLSTALNVVHLIDTTEPTVGNIALPPTLTGGQSATFTTVGMDNLDLATAQGRLVFSTINIALPFGPATSLGTFGFDTFTTTANLSATLPFIQSLYAAGSDPSVTTNGDNADEIMFRVTDFGGNVSTTNNSQPFGQVITPGPVATLNLLQSQSFTVSTPSAAVTVCNMVPGTECSLTTDTPNTTLTATIAGPSGSFVNPFTVVYFYRKDAGGTPMYIGSASMVLISDTGNPADVAGRVYGATLTFDATGLDPQANVPIFAVGVDASGDGLMTVDNANVTIEAGN